MTIDRNFVSPMDQFLKSINTEENNQSEAINAEKNKYRKVFALRDEPEQAEKKSKIWHQF